jgi:hypothetical protein
LGGLPNEADHSYLISCMTSSTFLLFFFFCYVDT